MVKHIYVRKDKIILSMLLAFGMSDGYLGSFATTAKEPSSLSTNLLESIYKYNRYPLLEEYYNRIKSYTDLFEKNKDKMPEDILNLLDTMKESYSEFKDAVIEFKTLVPAELQTSIQEYRQAIDESIPNNPDLKELDDNYNYALNQQLKYLESITNNLQNTKDFNNLKIIQLKNILSKETDLILRMAKTMKFILSDNLPDKIIKPKRLNTKVNDSRNALFSQVSENIQTIIRNLYSIYASFYRNDCIIVNGYRPSDGFKLEIHLNVQQLHLAFYNRMFEAEKKLDDLDKQMMEKTTRNP